MDEVLEFPCDFPIKAMGRAGGGFPAHVMSIISRYAPGFNEDRVSTRLSREENYVSVTVTIRATSRRQITDIYRALRADEQVLTAL